MQGNSSRKFQRSVWLLRKWTASITWWNRSSLKTKVILHFSCVVLCCSIAILVQRRSKATEASQVSLLVYSHVKSTITFCKNLPKWCHCFYHNRHAGMQAFFFVIYFVYFAIPRHFIRFSLPIASLVTQSAFTVFFTWPTIRRHGGRKCLKWNLGTNFNC